MSKEIKSSGQGSLKAEERILEAATAVFAEKGYDAAGVDEIAKRANVTKPLIYYYFKGKQSILQELIDRYLKNVVEEKEQYITSFTVLDKEKLYEGFDEKKKSFSENKKVLKVIAMEMLKDKPVDDSLLNKISQMYDLVLPKIENMEIDTEEALDIIITGFFFGTVPTLGLMLLGDEFCSFYNLDRDELDKRFFKLMKSV